MARRCPSARRRPEASYLPIWLPVACVPRRLLDGRAISSAADRPVVVANDAPTADRRRVAEPMLRTANERYRVYTVDEFLGECLGEDAALPPVPAEVSRRSRGARRRDWGARLFGAAMLFASVGTVAGLVGADLWQPTVSSRRARPARAPVGVRARLAGRGSVGDRTDSRPARPAGVPVLDARAAPRPKPGIVARTRRFRVRRVRADIPASGVSRRVALPVIQVRRAPRGGRRPMTAAASVTTNAATPRRSSAEFGFER
jgi:hypothetical protein